ncbi:YqgE/AlgH family protein [Pseudahrensia aquimaris]|uniref:UPF0301 protein ACFQ14_05905 n=1 Tax=Pseudahrensia aquimaris TaxID=744461 RepID=A0ABW3FG46_9HYPH
MNAKRNKNMDSLDLKGHCLIAMPGMSDPRFAKTVVLITSHDAEGSMGFILNQPVSTPTYDDILEELGLDGERKMVRMLARDVPVFRGGPVEQGRGFVLHTLDFASSNTMRLQNLAGLTATLDALKVLAAPLAPQRSHLFLGYAGWSAGQLEREIAENGWLTVQATPDLLFETRTELQYDAALGLLGISSASLSGSAGHA